MEKILCPSIMNLEADTLVEEIQRLNATDIDIFHLDIMDGSFVPNFGMSFSEISCVRRHSNKLLDCHMMVREPDRYVEAISDLGCDIIYIHPESDTNPTYTLSHIKKLNRKAGLVINPGTALQSVAPMFPLIDYLMIMSVNPGFCGQRYMDYVEPKIVEAVTYGEQWGFPVVIDGGVNREIMTKLATNGVRGFVLGNLILFKQNEKDYAKLVRMMRSL